jgi:hypothetical protein
MNSKKHLDICLSFVLVFYNGSTLATNTSRASKVDEFFIIVNHNMKEKMQSCSISTITTSIPSKILNFDLWTLTILHHIVTL